MWLTARHWDTWRVPGKVWTVGMTKIHKGINGFVEKPQQFINLLNGTGLVSQMRDVKEERWLTSKYNKMDPVTFAISPAHLAISVKAPRMKDAFHTREDVYIFDVTHPHHVKPVHLTPHDHGAISGLAFSPDGSKLAWLEMAEDGYESDRRVAVVHDTKNAIRWTDTWDRSPSSITVSCCMTAKADGSGLGIRNRSTSSPSTRAEYFPTTYKKQVTFPWLWCSITLPLPYPFCLSKSCFPSPPMSTRSTITSSQNSRILHPASFTV